MCVGPCLTLHRYTKLPLTLDMLKPMPELKAQVDAWIAVSAGVGGGAAMCG